MLKKSILWLGIYSIRVIILFVAVVVSTKINRRHYFWSNLCTMPCGEKVPAYIQSESYFSLCLLTHLLPYTTVQYALSSPKHFIGSGRLLLGLPKAFLFPGKISLIPLASLHRASVVQQLTISEFAAFVPVDQYPFCTQEPPHWVQYSRLGPVSA